MKELTFIEFKPNDRLIARGSGNKDSYDTEIGAYTNQGKAEGEIEITAMTMVESTIAPSIMRALYENDRKRVTKSALMRKAEMVKEDDKQQEDKSL